MLAALLAGMLLLGGCGSVRYPEHYVLNFPPPAPRPASPSMPLDGVIVREFGCPNYLCGGRIVYRPSPEQVGFYEYHRWAMDPRHSITRLLADTLRAQSIFRHVAIEERGAGAAYILSGAIEQLEEVDRGSDVQVVCAMSAQLLDAKTGALLWSGSASETLPVAERNVPGVVRALSTAAQQVAARLVESMTAELRSKR